MKEQPLSLAPSVRVVAATNLDLAQLAAWRRLWALLLAPDAEQTNAPSGELGTQTCNSRVARG